MSTAERPVPCPFCLSPPDLVSQKSPFGKSEHWVECGNFNCPMQEVSTRSYDKSTEAVRAWNTPLRVLYSRKHAQLRQLRQ